jgi:hydroxyacylglutathione hydrolase
VSLDRSAGFRALTPVEVCAEIDRGAILIDIREPTVFGVAHLSGSINVQFSARRFAERVASVIPTGATVLLVGDDESRVLKAASDLSEHSAGYLGYLSGGLVAWTGAGYSTSQLASLSIHDLYALLAEPEHQVTVLDVRELIEWEELGYIEGAILLPLREIAKRHFELPRTRPLAVICEQGIRSSTAASILARHGFAHLANVLEGMAGWRMAGYPVVDEVRLASPVGFELKGKL